MEISQLYMLAAVVKTSYEQCSALLVDGDQLSDDIFLLICKYTIALAKTYETIEKLIVNKYAENKDYTTNNNTIYLKALIRNCANLEDQIQERISLTIH